MKDHKVEHGSLQDKLDRAKGYLNERGINRNSVACQHRYKNSDGKIVYPTRKLFPWSF